MELDNFIIGKNRGEEMRVGKKATGACQKNRAAAAKHKIEESNKCLPNKIEQLLSA
jgi:hypothetical protein